MSIMNDLQAVADAIRNKTGKIVGIFDTKIRIN